MKIKIIHRFVKETLPVLLKVNEEKYKNQPNKNYVKIAVNESIATFYTSYFKMYNKNPDDATMNNLQKEYKHYLINKGN